MKLEPIIQNEVSQKEKYQYSILMHIYGIIKMVTITLHARQQKRHRCIEQSFGLCGSIGEGNGNPLQCFCLENPGDRGAWWAAVYGVTQSWT